MKAVRRENGINIVKEYLLILLGSVLYAASTVLFIFPNTLLLGGISGISVILEAFLPFSPGIILMVINFFSCHFRFCPAWKKYGNQDTCRFCLHHCICRCFGNTVPF